MPEASPAHDPLPLIAEVDLLILGGTSGAVACALATAGAGRSVYLAGPHAYLGEDIAARFDYWPEATDTFTGALAPRIFPAGPDPEAAPPTPMHVKRTLEQAMVEAGIPFLFQARPAGVLRDRDGRIRGAVLANRAGRQAVRAAEVLDATETGLLARAAGLPFTDPPRGPERLTHVTIGGPTREAPDLEAEPLPAMRAPGEEGTHTLAARRYTLTVDLGAGDASGLAGALAEVRERTWLPGTLQQSDVLMPEAPARIAGPARASEWPGPDAFPLEALEVEAGLWMLGRSLPVAPPVAAALARPAHAMAVGERLGRALATRPAAGEGGPLEVHCAGAEPVPGGRIRTPLGGLRPGDPIPATLPAPANTLPRLGRYDVLVIGGGTGGAPAGIAAAEAGAKTLVCETLGELGGVGTAGQIATYYHGNITGFTDRVNEGVARFEADRGLAGNPRKWSPAAKAHWYLTELRAAGGQAWFHTLCAGAWTENGRVRGVVVAGPYGYGLLEAGTVVDATGCADVAAAAGAPTRTIGAEHVAVQGTGLASIRPDRPYHNTDHNFSDDTDPVDATGFFVTTREKFREDFDLGQLVDSRERRQILGDIELGPADFLAERRFPDTLCVSASNFDTHGFTVHPLFAVKPPDKAPMRVHVPYRCLLPRGLEGLLVTGLGVSAHRDAIPVIRMQADVQNQGYAAGRAAAMTAESGTGLRAIDLADLQRHLVEIGNLPPSVLEDEDTFPVSDAKFASAVDEGSDTYEGLALLFAEPERARPLLRRAHDAVGTDLAARPWDAGWNYRGMGQFGMSLSEVDALLMALGRVGGPGAWPILLEKIETLPADPDFSHCRAVAEACEQLARRHPDPRAAPALAGLLGAPALRGHAQPTIASAQAALTDHPNETEVRNRALREIHLARALFRTGDHEALGRRTLEAYARDLRGPFARHARAVLEAGMFAEPDAAHLA